MEATSLRVQSSEPALCDLIFAHVSERGFQVLKLRSAKCSLKISKDHGGHTLVVKVRLYELPGGLLLVEWQRRRGCCLQSEAGWQALRRRLMQATQSCL